MIGHGRHRQLDALACKLLALPVERLVIGIFVDQDHSQQARPSEAACDCVKRRRWLRDRLAGPAAELLSHMLGHEPLPRDHVERLGDVLANLAKLAAATAWTRGRRGVNDAPARQIGRKVAPCRRLPPKALHLDSARRLGLCVILTRRRGQLLELQLHLIDEPLATFGARTEYLPLHLGNHQLQMLDQSLRSGQLGARLDQRCLQRIGVFGRGIWCRRHATIES